MKKERSGLTYLLMVSLGVFLLCGGVTESYAKKTMVTIGGGGVGGIFYTIAGGMAELINKNLPDVIASAQATGASVENTRLLGAKSIEFGLSDTNTALKAQNGLEPFGEPITNFRVLGRMFNPVFQVVIKKKHGVTSFAELKGKKIAAGALGSATYSASVEIFPAVFGLDRNDFLALGYRAANEAFKDGRIDAIIQQGGYPFPNLSELATSYDVVFLSMTDEAQSHIVTTYPQYIKYTIPAGVYKGQDEPVRSFAGTTWVGVRDDLPDDLVYRVTKAIYSEEGLKYLGRVHSIFKPITEEKALDWAMGKRVTPLHPGAARYYKELAGKLGREWKPAP